MVIRPLRPSAAPGAPALALGVWGGVKGGGRGPPLLGATGKILKSIVLSWIILYETRNYLLNDHQVILEKIEARENINHDEYVEEEDYYNVDSDESDIDAN